MIPDRLTQVTERACRAGMPLLLCVRLFGLSVSGEDLIPRFSGGNLRVAAPRLHFINGNPLERLHNGLSVPFDFQLSLSASPKGVVIGRALERFVVSYDLWEEKFSVVRERDRRLSSARLTAAQAEAWCLENLALPSAGLAADRNFWLRLDIRTGESRTAVEPGADGISIAALIDIFSRPARRIQDHWALETGPFRLGELKP